MRAFLSLFRLALLAAALSLVACGGEPPVKFNSTDITGSDWAREFTLQDAQGKTRTLSEFKGKAVIVFFGYTQCPDVCPTTLAAAAGAMKELGADADKVQVIFITLDPRRDTPKVLANYATAFHPSFIGLTADEATIAKTADDFKIVFQKQPGTRPDNYTIDHTAASYAYDPQGRLRLYVRHGETPQNIAADLRLLLAGK